MTAVRKLRQALAQLSSLLPDELPPNAATRQVRILEPPPAARTDGRGRTVVSRRMLRDVEGYESRFDDLLHAGYAWINMHCAGLLGDDILVVIEVPAALSTKGGAVTTSVNYSGPTARAAQNGWNANEEICFTDD